MAYTILTTGTFDGWFAGLRDRAAQRRIQARIDRMEDGNLGDWKPIGGGVAEARLAFGSGYRLYFTRRGLEIIALLCGGGKSSQKRDIRVALELAAALEKEWVMARKIKLRKWDSAEHLKTDEDCQAYLDACIAEAGDDAAFIAKALGTIARARGMTRLARDTGLGRENLYKALSGEGNPSFGTILKVVHAMGMELSLRPPR